MSLLEVEALTVRMDELEVLRGLELTVDARQAVGVLGPNGSGKTTLLNAVTGVVQVAGGRIRLAGRDITGAPVHEIANAGIARTFQSPRMFQRMTVADNIRPTSRRMSEPELDRLLDTTALAPRRHDLAGDLGLLDVKRLEIARAMASRPRVVLLDEPTGGLGPTEAADIVALIDALVLSQSAAIIVEHRLDALRKLCGRAVALDHGIKIAEGDLATVEQDAGVRRAYFGAAGPPGRNDR